MSRFKSYQHFCYFTLLLVFASCHSTPDDTKNNKSDQTSEKDKYTPLDDGSLYNLTVGDENNRDYSWLNKYFEYGAIDDSGLVIKTNVDSAISFYDDLLKPKKKEKEPKNNLDVAVELMNFENETTTKHPVFEYKNSDTQIWVVRGEGHWAEIWAEIFIHEPSRSIKKIEFYHKSETPGYGAAISEEEFENQFKGKKLVKSDSMFSLYQNDQKISAGQYRVDGISGATISSKGCIEMVNKGIKIYFDYLDN